MIKIFLIYRIATVALRKHLDQCIFKKHLTVKSYNTVPMRHDIACFLIPKLKNIGDHLRFAGFQNTLFMSFIDHGNNFFLCHI